jgi:hypothetical protein
LTNVVSDTSVRRMKTLPLRKLVRDPRSVQKLTAAGQSVRITNNGKRLWVVRPDTDNDANGHDERARRQAVDAELDRMLGEPKSKISAAQIILESRR